MTPSNFIQRLLELPNRIQFLIAFLAGCLVPFSFAPFNIWPLGILALSIFALLINNQSLKTVWWRSWWFGVGMYAVGVSWIYVSINGFGGAPAPLAAFLVIIFVFFMAAFFSLPFYAFGRWLSRHPLSLFIAFPACWLISEWLRTWLLTGFPWLFIGYGDLTNWLSGWAPVVGVMGLSLLSAFTAAFIAQLIYQPKKSLSLVLGGVAVIGIWGAGFALQNAEWTQVSSKPTSVAIVQPNIDQEDKWQTDFRDITLDVLREKTEPLWGRKIIIWPEAAITRVYSDALPFLNEVNRKASDSESGLITGIIFDDQEKDIYYNSVATFGKAIGIHHKRRLVPFGEYVPIEALRNLIEFFNLPTSVISLGPEEQHGLKVDDLMISPSVCYEVAFPDLIAKNAVDSQLLISVSNLGWFGDSLGRHQFMQMAQMRALETQHYYAYSTNNGPSAIFDRKGNITAQTKAFEQTTLSSEIYAVDGSTPFMRFGSLPVVVLSFFALMLLQIFGKKNPD
ncbi:apolipoprotein N-acyltransferase [Cellvibrio zantedeschiae]|uniref:apolipoprotein N-acyltransferase n=1 Tax=Cellvibrio zantedeschiae TaxID=1237077 RepID=UPI0016721A94|nr:apolipoprotein N-acyltransferase [Cellvibrio zantedeschiae]